MLDLPRTAVDAGLAEHLIRAQGDGPPTAAGVRPLYQWDCYSVSDEEYNTGAVLPAVAKIESRLHWKDSGACLDVPGGVATVGAAMQL